VREHGVDAHPRAQHRALLRVRVRVRVSLTLTLNANPNPNPNPNLVAEPPLVHDQQAGRRRRRRGVLGLRGGLAWGSGFGLGFGGSGLGLGAGLGLGPRGLRRVGGVWGTGWVWIRVRGWGLRGGGGESLERDGGGLLGEACWGSGQG
jgi:hypothetical protein